MISSLGEQGGGNTQLFLTWAHFLGRKSFTTCVHAVHWTQGRLGCKHSSRSCQLPVSALGSEGFCSVLQGIKGSAEGVSVPVLCPLCNGRRGSRGSKPHPHFGISCLSLISSSLTLRAHPCDVRGAPAPVPCHEHTESCMLLEGSLLKHRPSLA